MEYLILTVLLASNTLRGPNGRTPYKIGLRNMIIHQLSPDSGCYEDNQDVEEPDGHALLRKRPVSARCCWLSEDVTIDTEVSNKLEHKLDHSKHM